MVKPPLMAVIPSVIQVSMKRNDFMLQADAPNLKNGGTEAPEPKPKRIKAEFGLEKRVNIPFAMERCDAGRFMSAVISTAGCPPTIQSLNVEPK
jgi:hypothetical protein